MGVRSTVLAATVAWAIGEVLMRKPELDRLARAVWTSALLLMLVHVVLAFEMVYGWSHGAAVDATARQTAAVVGWAWGDGIFVNYVFLAVWAADAAWWWLAPASRASRPARVEAGRTALFLFMFVNGAVVFAAGIGRVIGALSIAAVLLSLASRRQRTISA
jgi:hypothetical protein